jgi:flagellar protein FlaG
MNLGTVSPTATGSNATPGAASPETASAPATALTQPAPVQIGSPSPQQLTMEVARLAAAQINEFLQSSSAASVEFTVDGSSEHIIVRVIDSATQQVIRQMPSEEALAISHALDRMTGLLLAQKA